MSHVKVRYANDAVIVEVFGRLGANGDAVRDRVRGLILDGYTCIVLNLRRVRSIDADGLNALAACRAAAAQFGARIVVSHLTARLSDLIAIAAISTAFDVYSSEREALRGLRGRVSAPVEGASDTRPLLGSGGALPITH